MPVPSSRGATPPPKPSRLRAADLLTIGDLARRTGVSVATLRFYEEKGLVAPRRSQGGRRLYRRADIRRISFVLIAQSVGLELSEIAATLARLPEARTPTAADWAAIAGGLKARLDARIAALQAARSRLDGCIGCGCLSLRACALYNAGDRASARGQGPRWALGDDPGA